MTKLSIPGKLFLAGEYAITSPGHTAILAATSMGLTIDISTATTTSSVRSNSISTPWHFDIAKPIQIGADTWRYVQAAIKIVKDYQVLQGQPITSQVQLTIHSTLNGPMGKLGLGSSAAVVVGIVSALNVHFALNLSLLTRFKLAGLAHYFVQKNGSLGDIAASTFGGVISFNSPDLSQLVDLDHPWINPVVIDQPWPNLQITPLAWPAQWRILLGATHESADTKTALQNLTLSSSFLTASQDCVTESIAAITASDYPAFVKALQRNQSLLQATLPAGYVTPKLAQLLASLGTHAGKISGAGYGDNGFAVVMDDATTLITNWQAAGLMTLPMTIFPENEVNHE